MENRLTTLKVLHIACAAVTLAVEVAIWASFRNQLPPVVPWFYSKPWGEGQLVGVSGLLLAPIIGGGVAAIFGVGSALKWVEGNLAGMMLLGSMVVQIVLCLGLLRVIWIVI